jgi:hypothetical protein
MPKPWRMKTFGSSTAAADASGREGQEAGAIRQLFVRRRDA